MKWVKYIDGVLMRVLCIVYRCKWYSCRAGRTWSQGQLPTPQYIGRIRSKTSSIKRPFITDCITKFSDLPPALHMCTHVLPNVVASFRSITYVLQHVCTYSQCTYSAMAVREALYTCEHMNAGDGCAQSSCWKIDSTQQCRRN